MASIQPRPVSGLHLATLHYTTLGQRVATGLRNEIIENRLPAGTKITESELSQTLNVSRTVVREAITILVQEGLVDKAPNRYTKVASYTPKDIQEIFDLRGALEMAGARVCIDQDDIVERLVRREQKMLEINRQQQIDRLAFVYADMEFHTLIVSAADNSRLLDAWNKILSPLLRLVYGYVRTCTEESPLGVVTYDHGKIIRAFASRDYDLAARTLLEHTVIMRNILLQTHRDPGGKK